MGNIVAKSYNVIRGFSFKRLWKSTRFTLGKSYQLPLFDKDKIHVGDCQITIDGEFMTVIAKPSFFQNLPTGTYNGYLKEFTPNANPDLTDPTLLFYVTIFLNEV